MSDILKAAAHPMVFPWLGLVLGLVVGSFLNVVIHRLPKMMERGWQEECAELLRTGEPYGSPVPPPDGASSWVVGPYFTGTIFGPSNFTIT